MKPIDAYALLGGMDEDLILDAIPPVWLGGAQPPKRKPLAGFYDRFMSSGWVAAVLSVVVALAVISGLVLWGRGGLSDDPTPGGMVDGTASESLPMAGEDFLWIVKDGKSDFGMHANYTTAGDAADMLSERMRALTGEHLYVIPYDGEATVEHAFFFTPSIGLGEQGYQIMVKDGWIYFAAGSDAGFARAIERLLRDAAVQGGLALPPNYHVKDSGVPLWLVKDGEAQFHISTVHSGGKAEKAVGALIKEVKHLTGATLPMAPENMENVEWLIEFVDDEGTLNGGFFLHANGWQITIMASSEKSFKEAVKHLMNDLALEGNSLSLPADYLYEETGAGTGVDTDEGWLWIVKEGRSDFVVETPTRGTVTDTIWGAAQTLHDTIEKEFGITLPTADPSAPVDYSHTLRVAVDETLGDYGYRIMVTGNDVVLLASAERYQSFTYAINRLLADGKVDGGLRLPRDYAVKVVDYESYPVIEPETEPTPERIPDEAIRAFTDKFLYEQYPALVGIGLDSFECKITQTSNPQIYSVKYNYRLCGMHTYESYSIRLNVVEGGFALIDTYGSNEGDYSQYHTMCTPEKLKKAQAELTEQSGEESGGYLKVRDGQLLLVTEVIVSLTPPPGADPSGGCGIDHDHVFYTVVVCP